MWLFDLLKREAAKVPKLIDPWSGSGGTYVGSFRKELEEIAADISGNIWGRFRVRFNEEFGCAEMLDPAGDIVARIRVHGSECSPYEAVVKTDLPPNVKMLFLAKLPVRVEFQTLHL